MEPRNNATIKHLIERVRGDLEATATARDKDGNKERARLLNNIILMKNINHDNNGSYKIIFILFYTILMKNVKHDRRRGPRPSARGPQRAISRRRSSCRR